MDKRTCYEWSSVCRRNLTTFGKKKSQRIIKSFRSQKLTGRYFVFKPRSKLNAIIYSLLRNRCHNIIFVAFVPKMVVHLISKFYGELLFWMIDQRKPLAQIVHCLFLKPQLWKKYRSSSQRVQWPIFRICSEKLGTNFNLHWQIQCFTL